MHGAPTTSYCFALVAHGGLLTVCGYPDWICRPVAVHPGKHFPPFFRLVTGELTCPVYFMIACPSRPALPPACLYLVRSLHALRVLCPSSYSLSLARARVAGYLTQGTPHYIIEL